MTHVQVKMMKIIIIELDTHMEENKKKNFNPLSAMQIMHKIEENLTQGLTKKNLADFSGEKKTTTTNKQKQKTKTNKQSKTDREKNPTCPRPCIEVFFFFQFYTNFLL